eukprot:SAG11_NODE_2096_length_3832_cov_2.091347_2_plen_816_part_00
MYGTAQPGETVTISGLDRRSAQGVPYPTVADENGAWRVQLDPYQGPAVFNATIAGSVSTNVITIRDIVYGDVILCSGQSNMNKPVSYVFNASAEIAAATHKNIRLFSVPGSGVPNCADGSPTKPCGPQANWTTQQCMPDPSTGHRPCAWLPLSPKTVQDFSAVCYLTVTEMMRIQPKLAQSTIFGLVQAAVDGTTVEEWSPPASLALCPLKPTLIKDRTSQHFNGMIAPLVGFSVKMTLWYQGEADAGPQARNTTPGNTRCADGATNGCDFVDAYACRFSSMINTWRDLWGMGDFAFIFAQLAPVPGAKMAPQHSFGSNWPTLRLQQAAALPAPGSAVDTSGMAVIADIGDTLAPPHPKNKTEVGRRMALQALHVAYAYQSLASPSAADESLDVMALPPGAPMAQLPYDGFADGPILLNATRTSDTELTLTYSNAEGLALKPTYECGIGEYNRTGAGCCDFDRNWETSTATRGDADYLWSAVPAHKVKLLPAHFATAIGRLLLTVTDASSVQRVRSNSQMYPQCVLTNKRQLVAAPLLVNVTESGGSTQQQQQQQQQQQPHSALSPPKGVSLTPPMGFNSWNFYHCNIDERAIKQIALALKSSGLAAKGYRYVNIDDCWQVAREPVTGVIVPDPARFPSGLKAIADWLHEHDMMFGIYTAAHGSTCQSRPGSYLYEQIDSQSFCEFGIDYLKIDQCGGDSYERHHQDKNTSWLKFQRGFKECLQSTGRAIVQSVESCGSVTGCGQWIANCANLWRTGSDLEATWGSVMKNLDQTAPLYSLAGVRDTGMGLAGHWNDPDMLQVKLIDDPIVILQVN